MGLGDKEQTRRDPEPRVGDGRASVRGLQTKVEPRPG